MQATTMKSSRTKYAAIVAMTAMIYSPTRLLGQEQGMELESEPVETDRDSFTRSPRLVEKKTWVIEAS